MSPLSDPWIGSCIAFSTVLEVRGINSCAIHFSVPLPGALTSKKLSRLIGLQNPKSLSFNSTEPSLCTWEIKILAGWMSLWTNLFLWMCSTPRAIWSIAFRLSGIGPSYFFGCPFTRKTWAKEATQSSSAKYLQIKWYIKKKKWYKL